MGLVGRFGMEFRLGRFDVGGLLVRDFRGFVRIFETLSFSSGVKLATRFISMIVLIGRFRLFRVSFFVIGRRKRLLFVCFVLGFGVL